VRQVKEVEPHGKPGNQDPDQDQDQDQDQDREREREPLTGPP